MLWEAYYSIEPYTNHLTYLASIEAGVNRRHKIILPEECDLNVVIEDKLLTEAQRELNKKSMIKAFTDLANSYLTSAGKPTIEQQITSPQEEANHG